LQGFSNNGDLPGIQHNLIN